MHENFEECVRCGNDLDEINGKPTGIIRVSLGAMSTMRDISTFIQFLRRFVDMTIEDHGASSSLAVIGPDHESIITKRQISPEMGGKIRVLVHHPAILAANRMKTGVSLRSRSWRLHWKF